jgi:hypothetical protein
MNEMIRRHRTQVSSNGETEWNPVRQYSQPWNETPQKVMPAMENCVDHEKIVNEMLLSLAGVKVNGCGMDNIKGVSSFVHRIQIGRRKKMEKKIPACHSLPEEDGPKEIDVTGGGWDFIRLKHQILRRDNVQYPFQPVVNSPPKRLFS